MYKILKDFTGYELGYGELKEYKSGDVVDINWHLAEGALKDGVIQKFEPEETKIITPETKEKPKKGKNA